MWQNVLGHEEIKSFLKQYINRKEKPHALLFAGPGGLGKRMLAQEFAKSLLCFKGDGEDLCESCRRMDFEGDNVSHPDFIRVAREINPSSGKLRDINIEQVRELQSKTGYAPVLSTYKVCLIEDVDRMRTEAANCLLKLLEEPPENWVLILLAESEEKLLTTILSRVVVLRFHSLPLDQAKDILLAKCPELNRGQAEVLLQLSEGSLGKALELKEKNIWENREQALTLLEAFPINSPVSYVADRKWLEKLERPEALQLVNLWQLLLRDMLMLKAAPDQQLYNNDIQESLQAKTEDWTCKAIKKSLIVLDEAHRALEGNAGIKLVMEATILKIDKIYKE